MKLKNDISSNAITSEIVGIASKDSNLKIIRGDALVLIKNVLQKITTSQCDKTDVPCRNEENSPMSSSAE